MLTKSVIERLDLNAIVSVTKEESILVRRGKELEENGFGICLEKKGEARAGPTDIGSKRSRELIPLAISDL